MYRILILDPDPPGQAQLAKMLSANGFNVEVVDSFDERESSPGSYAAVIADAGLSKRNPSLIRTTPTIVLDRSATIASAVEAMRQGASDYLTAPADKAELLSALDRVMSARIPDPLTGSFPMIGNSEPMKHLFDKIARVAPTESTVLILGESGTGKELVARALHSGSNRRQAPMMSLNCATIPSDLIEAELFGHDSAASDQRGLMEAASGGTLFLDEVGELPAEAQGRLLRALESQVDVRLIAATHRNLEKLINDGQFREDLYYRLNVFSLEIPPLRERGDDVLLLADAILARTAEKLEKPPLHFSAEAKQTLGGYHWPGNVRELENAIQRAVILCDNKTIENSLLAVEPATDSSAPAGATPPEQTIEDYFVSFVTTHQDQFTETELAEKLGISRKSLWERRQRLNIPRKKTRKRGPRREIS